MVEPVTERSRQQSGHSAVGAASSGSRARASFFAVVTEKVLYVAIHDFMSEPTRAGAEDRRFHGQLMHVRECLEQATLRTIYGTPYDGEVAVDPGEIARGASQFGPAL